MRTGERVEIKQRVRVTRRRFGECTALLSGMPWSYGREIPVDRDTACGPRNPGRKNTDRSPGSADGKKSGPVRQGRVS